MLKQTLMLSQTFLHVHVDPNLLPFFVTNLMLWYTHILLITFLRAQVDPNFVPFHDRPDAQKHPYAFTNIFARLLRPFVPLTYNLIFTSMLW